MPHIFSLPDDVMKLTECGQAEENVDEVGGQIDRGFPLFT
jgi:hypothetical protein